MAPALHASPVIVQLPKHCVDRCQDRRSASPITLMHLRVRLSAAVLQAFMAGYRTPKDNVHLLEDLFGTRREMAHLMGAPSYAHYTLENATLAGCPEAVESFLVELLAAIKPKVMGVLLISVNLARWTFKQMHMRQAFDAIQVEEEVKILRRYKAKHLGRSADGLQLDAWDRLFYMRIAQVQQNLSGVCRYTHHMTHHHLASMLKR